MMSHPSRSYTLLTHPALVRLHVSHPSLAVVRMLSRHIDRSDPARTCSASPPQFTREEFPHFYDFFDITIPFSVLVLLPLISVSRRGFSRPTHLPFPERNLVLPHGLLFLLLPSAAILYCTVLYANINAMTVGTNGLNCGFN